MINIYIKKLEKEDFFEFYKKPKWLIKFFWKIIQKSNLVFKKEIDENKKIYFIANIEKKSTYKNLKKKLQKEKTKTQKIQIILSKKLKQYKENFKDYKVIDGRQTYINALESVLKKILQETPIQMQDIYILTNRYTEQSINIIRNLIQKVKTMNIITQEIQKYKTLEEMMQEKGIAICIANNKKKSLKKAKIIINLDFSNEQIKNYIIYRNAILINLSQEKITSLKGFEGIIVQDIDIYLENQEWLTQNKILEDFRKIEIYETIANSKQKIKVDKLYGNNGEIDEKEIGNWKKILTN